MSVISAKLIREPRRHRHCDQCGKRMWSYVRLYGSACDGDPKYVIGICGRCACKSGDTKVLKAVGK